MKYDDENWIKIYTRDTAGWVILSWQARGIALELSRKLPKNTGELSLGRRGIEALGPLLRAPWPEIKAAVEELIADGRLEYDAERQVIRDPQHAERQNAVSTSKARTQKWRDAKRPAALVPPPSSAPPASTVTLRDVDRQPVTTCDAVTSPRDEVRREVTTRDQEKRREEKEYKGPPGGGLTRAEPLIPPATGSLRPLVLDEPLTDQRRKDHSGQIGTNPPRDIAPEWADFVDHQIKNSTLFGSDAAIDAAWRKWVRRENGFAAERRKNSQSRGRPDTRQPMRDPNPEWLRRASNGDDL